MKRKQILWIGPVLRDSLFLNSAISPAASLWQSYFINELQKKSFDVSVLSHLPKRIFPFSSPLVLRRDDIFFPHQKGSNFSYLNFPIIRHLSLTNNYQKALNKTLDKIQPDLIVTYNLEPYITRPVYKTINKNSIPWVGIVADMPHHNPENYYNNSLISFASGRIFLSWNNYLDKKSDGNGLFFEGGVPSLNIVSDKFLNNSSKKFKIAYFGTISEIAGVELFLECTSLIPQNHFEFHIVGNGNADLVRRYTKKDSRIIFHGPLQQADLDTLGRQMDLFIDPRKLSMSHNNFPSKILTYLSFEKPIISTMGMGLSPEYSEILLPLKEGVPLKLATAIQSVAGWSDAHKEMFQKKVKLFNEKKSWQHQTDRFIDWLEQLKIISF